MKTLDAPALEQLELTEPAEWKTGELDAYVGGLSAPSKMPGYAYSLPAAECRTGTKLRDVALVDYHLH